MQHERWALIVFVLPASALMACGPLQQKSYASCSSVAEQQARCHPISAADMNTLRDECDQQYGSSFAGCPEAIDAFAKCLPTATSEELNTLTSACTQLAGDVATRCPPTQTAQNSNTPQSRGYTSYN